MCVKMPLTWTVPLWEPDLRTGARNVGYDTEGDGPTGHKRVHTETKARKPQEHCVLGKFFPSSSKKLKQK